MAMAAPTLESWATEQLEAMDVDGVFAPYVIGMLGDGVDESDDDTRFSVHQVLMGWLSPEDEERAMEFVEDLLKYYGNPTLVPDQEALMVKTVESVVDDGDDERRAALLDAELKASAPMFVPHVKMHSGPLSSGASTEGGAEHDLADGEDGEEDETVDVMQDEDTFFWSVVYDIVGHLQLKFPEVDPTRLCDLLRLVELDVDKAHAVIKATLEKESVGSTQVCRHYLAGDCRRADCMFVHDTHAITCRFWLRGMCLQEENTCVFAHDFVEVYALDLGSQARDYDSEDENDDGPNLNIEAEEMFPSLGTAVSAKHTTHSSSYNSTSTGSWGSSSATNAMSNLSLNFARAVSVQPAASTPAPSYDSYNSNRRTPLPSRPLYHKTAEAVAGGRWLSTGAQVTAQYKQLREDAYEFACARNKCFMEATRAYQSGNRSLARSLSTQGHEYNVKMKRCHYLAATQIFESRNPKSQLYNDRVMDLHGLHVAEAVEFLSHMLPTLANEGLESIYIVTGSGHHSKGPTGNARLLPAVERFLGTEGYQFSPVADRRGYVGMVMVDLRW